VPEAVITAMRLALADDGLPGVTCVCKAFSGAGNEQLTGRGRATAPSRLGREL